MLTKLSIKNFKKLNDVSIDLESAVVFVGPNNSGKTSALQAITLWEIGLRKWAEKRKASKVKQRAGVAINRRDLYAVPIPSAVQLWNDLNVRGSILKVNGTGRDTKNVLIEIIAEGFTNNKSWKLGFEFDYANSEVMYCRIIRENENVDYDSILEYALNEKIGYLPPMSGLANEEDKLEPGSIQVRIGEGRTAEVLRNLCWNIFSLKGEKWSELVALMKQLFSIEVMNPNYDKTTGRISMSYHESTKKEMDLVNVGRGFQQILLLFAFIYAGENTILLLDEPDAHLEIIRQKEIYNLLTEIVKKEKSQLIIATHSEAILNESAQKDKIIAFLGQPHTVNNNSQLVKALTTIGFDQYLLAAQYKWILYLEGSTDLSMLKAFAKVLDHPVKDKLEMCFTKYTSNNPRDARNHFYALREAVTDFKGLAIFDKIEDTLQQNDLTEIMWNRREIENYIPIPEVLKKYAQSEPIDLFTQQKVDVMEKLINDYIPPIALRDKNNSWWSTTKMSDDLLYLLFKDYFRELNMPIIMRKGNYFELVLLSLPEWINIEVKEKLDSINNLLT